MAWLMGFPASRSAMLPFSQGCCSASRALGRFRGSLRRRARGAYSLKGSMRNFAP